MGIFFGAVSLGNSAGMMPDYGKAKEAAINIFSILDRKPVIDIMSRSGEQYNPKKF